MSIDCQVVELMRGLVAEDPTVRARSVDSATDSVRDSSSDDAAVLAYLLAALRVSETDNGAQATFDD